jgi:hypothetical protein
MAALTALASAASAQTVIVRNAAPSAPIELRLNDDAVATATADSTGTATLSTDVSARLRKDETSVHVSVDDCGQQRRILLVEAGVSVPPPGACSRVTVRDLFSARRVTTFVIDVGGTRPVVWIRQGPAPADWLGDREAREERTRTWTPAPVGLIVSGGVGGAGISDFEAKACGDAPTCSASNVRPVVAASLAFWLKPWLGVDIGVLHPGRFSTSGSGTSFTFNSTLETRIVTIDGRVGGQFGPARIYGIGGVDQLSAAMTTTQTVTSGAVGGQTFGFKAEGWSWMAGAGVETWIVPRVGLFAEGVLLSLNGSPIDNGQGSIEDKVLYVVAGARVAFGHKR